MASLSHHPRRQPDVIKFAEEVAAGNRALDELGDALPSGCRQTYLEGNHEGWSRSFEAENGALESVLAIDKHLRLAERGIDWVSLRRQDDFSLGPVAYLHGISESRHHSQTHADDFAPRVGKRHVVYGHMHTFQAATSKAGYSARCCGFLGDERNSAFGYKKGRPAPWVQGFLIQEVRGSCVTDTEVRITNGRAVFRGKVY
jgi:predicted phosphodiesterase